MNSYCSLPNSGLVFEGKKKKKTSGGLTKQDIRKNKRGRCVSKRRSDLAKKSFKENGLEAWMESFMNTRQQMGVKGFIAVQKGSQLYKNTVESYVKTQLSRQQQMLRRAGSTLNVGFTGEQAPPPQQSQPPQPGLRLERQRGSPEDPPEEGSGVAWPFNWRRNAFESGLLGEPLWQCLGLFMDMP